MLAGIEHAQGAIHGVEVVAELFETLLCGYEIAGELGALGSQGGDDMRFGHTGKYGARPRIFFGPMLHNTGNFAPDQHQISSVANLTKSHLSVANCL